MSFKSINMPRTKELSERLRNTIIDTYNAGSGYKEISKVLRVHISTVRKVKGKCKVWKTTASLPRTGRPPKISKSTARKLLQEASKNPRVTSRELQEHLAASDIHVHSSTICRHLNAEGVSARVPRKKPLLTKKTQRSRPSLC